MSAVIVCQVTEIFFFLIINFHRDIRNCKLVYDLTVGLTIISDAFLNLTDSHDKLIVNRESNLIKMVCFWKRSSKRLLDQLRMWTSPNPAPYRQHSVTCGVPSFITELISVCVVGGANPTTGVFPFASQKTPDNCVTEGSYGTVWRIGVYLIPPANKVRKASSSFSFTFYIYLPSIVCQIIQLEVGSIATSQLQHPWFLPWAQVTVSAKLCMFSIGFLWKHASKNIQVGRLAVLNYP